MSSPSNASYEIVRGIGRWDLVALMVNITIGSGILGLPAKLFALTGAYSVLALILCAALLAIVAICFAEVGSRFTHTGGPYLFTRTAFGATPGFIVGWLYWVSRVLTFATICNLLVTYVVRVAPALQGPFARVAIISVVVFGIGLVNLVGIRQATIVSNGLTLLKVSFLIAFGVDRHPDDTSVAVGAGCPAARRRFQRRDAARHLRVRRLRGSARRRRRDAQSAPRRAVRGGDVVADRADPLRRRAGRLHRRGAGAGKEHGAVCRCCGRVMGTGGRAGHRDRRGRHHARLAQQRIPRDLAAAVRVRRARRRARCSRAGARAIQDAACRDRRECPCSYGSRQWPARSCPRSRSRRARAWSCTSPDASR